MEIIEDIDYSHKSMKMKDGSTVVLSVDDMNGILDMETESDYKDDFSSYIALYGMLVVYAAV